MMAPHARFSSALLSFAVAVFAFVLLAEAAFEKGHVHLPFISVGKAPRLSSRDAADVVPDTIPVGNSRFPYQVEVEVGTPPQKMHLAISTMSGLSWLQDARASICQPREDYIYPDDDYRNPPIIVEIPSRCRSGFYNKSVSSTFLNANQQYSSFTVERPYPLSTVYAQNMTDTLVVGGLFEFPDMPLGLADSASESFTGVLGLGYSTTGYGYAYESDKHLRFMDRMVEGGHVATRAFSIWLDDAENGHLLFGAIDQSGYEGKLLRIKADNEYAFSGTFGVTAVEMTAAADSESELDRVPTHDFPLGITISPGELFSFLPESLFNKIVNLTGASHNLTTGVTTIACDAAAKNTARFSLQLAGPDGPTLNFETADLIIPRDTYSFYSYRQDETACAFALQSSERMSNAYYVVGSSLLRRSYLVFDLENEEVAVAPVKTKSTSDKSSPTIVAFASSGAPAPSASLYCSGPNCYESCAMAETCSGPLPTETGDTRYSPGDGGSRPGTLPSNGEATYWRDVAIGVGVSLGATALIAGIAITVIWGRICRNAGYNSEKQDAEDGASGEHVQALGPVMSAPTSMGSRMQSPPVILPPATLPVIREEESGSRAPQLPLVETAGPITPPEPLTPSKRDSVAVSAVSSEDAPPPESTAAMPTVAAEDEPSKPVTTASDAAEPPLDPPRSPKGKEVARPEIRET